jgi:ligand-binding SRPBCC domain-containing protein
MSISACPIAIVLAPLDHVWEFLSEPKNYALWWDAQTQRIVPEGRAHAGQKIDAKTIEAGKSWDVTVTVNAVNESKHQIDLTTSLPFGITVYNHITCTPLKDGTTQVSFG